MATSHPVDKRTRIKRRLITLVIYLALVLSLAWFIESQATTTIIFVRHAEKLPDVSDPGLSAAGKIRAQELSRLMQEVDVDRGVDVVYASQYKRTEETVLPLAMTLGLEIQRYDAADTVSVLSEILHKHKGKISLVAAHSNTIKPLIEELGGSKHLPDIDEAEYDNIYVVVIPWFGKVKTLRHSYGAPFVPEANTGH